MRLSLAFIVLGTALSSSCLAATEVDVTVKTDLRCSGDGTGFRLQRTDLEMIVGAETRHIGDKEGCEAGRVGNMVFVPGTEDSEVHLRVTGTIEGQPPLRADRILRFLKHQSLRLDVDLSSACVGVPCDTMTETCIEGKCVPIPSNVPPADAGADGDVPPIDAGADGTTLDAEPDVIPFDGPTLDAPTGDAGKCPPSPLSSTDIHWAFDEGTSATTTWDDNNVYSATPVVLIADPPCGTALSFSASSPLNLTSTNWQPTPTFAVAFTFDYISGSGTVLARNIGKSGGWEFRVDSNSALNFDVYDNTMKAVTLTLAIPKLQPLRIVGAFAQNTMSLKVNGVGNSKVVSLNLSGYVADISAGSPIIKFIMDDLWLGR